MKLPDGFLKAVTDHLVEKYRGRINEDYAFALSEVLLSSCCWDIKCKTKYGDLRPNIWVQVILPSGDIKSNPVKKFVLPILRKVETCFNEESEDEIYKKLVISSYTPESIIDFMNVHPENKYDPKTKQMVKELQQGNLGLIWVDESTILARAAKNKNYMSGILETDSLIYDGGISGRYTISHGLQEVHHCYKAKIQATTPDIYSLMEDGDIIQGGWNRFDVVVGKEKNIEKIRKHDDSFFEQQTNQMIDVEFDFYATKLLKVINSKAGTINLDEDAKSIWCDYEIKCKADSIDLEDQDLRRGYKNRMAEKVLKRAILYTISKHIEVIDNATDGILLVEREEMQMAIDNQEEYYKHWVKMLEERGKQPPTSTVTTNRAEREYFEKMFKENMVDRLISRQKLIKVTQWNSNDKRLISNIVSAHEEEKIIELSDDEVKKILRTHKEAKEWGWFERMYINPKWRKPPTIFKWVGKTDQKM
jgi:hypothetical protein